MLKPNGYCKQYWYWLVSKIEKIINSWSHKWLSRAGRLVLIKYVLLSIHVYWISLAWVPIGILNKIRSICSKFLWSGKEDKQILPWVVWDNIEKPKEWGGWGIKQIKPFASALAAKSIWRILSENNLWTSVVRRKYIDPIPLDDWIRTLDKENKRVSNIWKATIFHVFDLVGQGLAWNIGNGEHCRIGLDPWVGCNENCFLSEGLRASLHQKGLITLAQINAPGQSTIWAQAWRKVDEIGLENQWVDEWKA